MDFIVLDIQGPPTGTPTPIILGRPFLATCNAQINCRSGQLEITFGNMKFEQNIFSACNLTSLEDDVEDVNVIVDSLVQEHVDDFCVRIVLRIPEFSDALTFVDDLIASFDSSPSLVQDELEEGESLNWVEQVEPLPLDAPQQIPSSLEHPTLELKPLTGIAQVCLP